MTLHFSRFYPYPPRASTDGSPAQAQGVGENCDAGECHRRGEDGVGESVLAEDGLEEFRYIYGFGEERVEDACGDRDQEHVVGEGPEQVLLERWSLPRGELAFLCMRLAEPRSTNVGLSPPRRF